MLTTPGKRIEKLLNSGVPATFLQALEQLQDFDDLQYIIAEPDAAYFYLPSICDAYHCLSGWDVTPVCNGSSGETFYALLSNTETSKFVLFELENDEIYEDFGSNFSGLLVHVLIQLYEMSELDLTELTALGERLGFENSQALFQALAHADQSNLRSSVEADENWRKQHLPTIING